MCLIHTFFFNSIIFPASVQLLLAQLPLWKHAFLTQVCDWQTSTVTGLLIPAVKLQRFYGGPTNKKQTQKGKYLDYGPLWPW